MLPFTLDLYPTIIIQTVQHPLTHRNGQASDVVPIVQVETLQNRSLSHVSRFSRIFAGHFWVAFLAIRPRRSGVSEVAWGGSPFNRSLWPSATAAGSL
jgi:hypothetical protein